MVDEIQKLLYIQAGLQCNFDDNYTRNGDILKNWPWPDDKTLLKCALCHIFLFDILRISVKIGAHIVYKVVKWKTCLYLCERSKCLTAKFAVRMHTRVLN